MRKQLVEQKLKESGLVAVVRARGREEALQIAEACVEGGVRAIEVTFTVPQADQVIRTLASRYDPEAILIGAGTVLDADTARTALDAGAAFVVSPALNLPTLKLCQSEGRLAIPGIMTVTEALNAQNAGASLLKLFPGELFGPAFIRALRGPLPDIAIMPTGGVDLDNVSEWIAAGAVAVGMGSKLTGGSREQIAALARNILNEIRTARGQS